MPLNANTGYSQSNGMAKLLTSIKINWKIISFRTNMANGNEQKREDVDFNLILNRKHLFFSESSSIIQEVYNCNAV